MADNGILILYNKVDIFIYKKIREGILSIALIRCIIKKSHILKMVLYKTKTYYYTYIM